MVQITIDNRRLTGMGILPPVAKELSDRLSYLQAGYRHSIAFQERRWDGRRRLVSFSGDGVLTAPLGMSEGVVEFLRELKIDYEIADKRIFPDYRLGLDTNFQYNQLRDYQMVALRAAVTKRGLLGLRGRGIIKMPPRSGKTLTAAGIIASLDVRTLFIVPSTLLLYQAKNSLEEALKIEVGVIGNQEWDIKDVTVATVQTLIARRGHAGRGKPPTKDYVRLLRSMDLLIVDECHHLSGESEWRKVIQDSSAAYKIGLSATVFLEHERECELGVIWLRACTGEILVDISTSDLIEAGYLVRPEIRLYPVREPDYHKSKWSATLQKRAVYKNPHRNRLIVELALRLMKEQMQVVVITNRVEQIGILFRGLIDSGGRDLLAARITGGTTKEEREKILHAFRQGTIKILVSTVMDEGIDLPEIDAVINAEGGCDIKSTYQRMRCLTPAPGKTRAVVVDFIDLTNRYFASHSLDRLDAYRAEKAFKVKVYKDYPPIAGRSDDKSVISASAGTGRDRARSA